MAQEDLSPVAHISDQVLIVQVTYLKKSSHRITDIAMWAFCWLRWWVGTGWRSTGLHGPNPKDQPEVPDLIWADYDMRFRQAAAGNGERQWALLDAGLYTECVTMQAG